jgi:hypothetical protein
VNFWAANSPSPRFAADKRRKQTLSSQRIICRPIASETIGSKAHEHRRNGNPLAIVLSTAHLEASPLKLLL